ncbi:hypothetical protein CHELA40_50431 [Chelatococcus asaccharovorans]|nr:hypothetical protein CHELA17_20396 [Chelatococcus asaccharovorans]CAH1692803.1 hypothetical protein CHELA40_50431 [Chelatococcus asaccharovorans]
MTPAPKPDCSNPRLLMLAIEITMMRPSH